MSEIEITLPTVQYGNVKVRATPEELGISSLADAAELGVAAAVYLNAFTQGWKIGTTIDVQVAPVGPNPEPTDQSAVDAHEAAVEAVKALGATEVEYGGTAEGQRAAAETEAPWNSPAPAVDTASKPWENGSAAPAKPATIDWS